MMERLQVEYDSFFLRAIYYLYSSQKLGAWQFLAVIPYNMVTLRTLWKIFYFLHSSDNQARDILNPLDTEEYSKKVFNDELRTEFEEKLDALEDAEAYYLLNTFANMALAREDKDMDFINACTIDLLKVSVEVKIVTRLLILTRKKLKLIKILMNYCDMVSISLEVNLCSIIARSAL